MNAQHTLHDVIADIIAEVVDAHPQAPDEVRTYTDRVLEQVDQHLGNLVGRQAPETETLERIIKADGETMEVELTQWSGIPAVLTEDSPRDDSRNVMNALELWYRDNVRNLPEEVFDAFRYRGTSEHFTFGDSVALRVQMLRFYDRAYAQAQGATPEQRLRTFGVLRNDTIRSIGLDETTVGYSPEVLAIDTVMGELRDITPTKEA